MIPVLFLVVSPVVLLQISLVCLILCQQCFSCSFFTLQVHLDIGFCLVDLIFCSVLVLFSPVAELNALNFNEKFRVILF